MSSTTAQLERSEQGGVVNTPPLLPCAECGYYNSPETPICFDCGKDLIPNQQLSATARPSTVVLGEGDKKAIDELGKTVVILSLLFVVFAFAYNKSWLILIGVPLIFLGSVVGMIIHIKKRRSVIQTQPEAERLYREHPTQQSAQLNEGTTQSFDTPKGILQIADSHASHAKQRAAHELGKIINLLKASDLDEEERLALSSSRRALNSQWERAEIALTEIKFTRWQNRVQGTISGIIQADVDLIYPEAGRKQLQFLKDTGREIKIGAEVLAEASSGVSDEGVLARARDVCSAVDSLLDTLNNCERMLRRIEVVRAVRDAGASIADGTRVVSLAANRTEEEREAATIALDLARTDFLDTELLLQRWQLDELSKTTERQESNLDEHRATS